MNSQDFWASNGKNFIADTLELLKIPSISTAPEHAGDIEKAASWVSSELKKIGLENIQLLKKDKGNPVVYGDFIVDPTLPTLLLYGHYDVQPADPVEEWTSDPFIPEIRDGAIYGRGTTDNKAQFMSNMAALAYYIQSPEPKKWNIKVAIEGEEEIGGPTIDALIADPTFETYFKADYAYISDGPWAKDNVPSIEFSLRGLVYFDLEIRTSSADMHSGLYGNAVMNPANLAGYVIYKLKDILANSVRVPNIYKQMRRLNDAEIGEITQGSETWEEVMQHSGSFVVTPYRRRGKEFAPAILTGTRPSLDVHGIQTGFTEKGRMKTVIPSTALVKFSIRLVPHMDPKTTEQLVQKYMKKIMPKGVDYTLTTLSASKPYLTDPSDVQIEKLKAAYQEGFGLSPVLVPSGGSIGLVTTLFENHGTKTLLASYGLPDDRLHGPNEKYNLSQFEGGYKTLVAFLSN